MRFFGGLGLAGMAVSLLTFVYLTLLYVLTDTQQRKKAPDLYCSRRVMIISVLLLLVGFLAELIASQGERIAGSGARLLREKYRASASVDLDLGAHHRSASASDSSGAVRPRRPGRCWRRYRGLAMPISPRTYSPGPTATKARRPSFRFPEEPVTPDASADDLRRGNVVAGGGGWSVRHQRRT